MNSLDLKTVTLSYLLYRRNFLGAFTESINASDVLGITRNLYAWEFEIKISKEDLAKELKAIRYLTGVDMNLRRARGANKLEKHSVYLGKELGVDRNYFVPSRFSFVVPDEISEYAARAVEKTPYGVYYQDHGSLFSRVTPKRISSTKISEKNLLGLVRKASTESLNLREKLRDLTK